MTSPWSPTDYVIDGVFATDADLLAAADELQALTGAPVVAAVFSGRWLIRSLSRARSHDARRDEEIVDRLRDELYTGLATAEDKFAFVTERVEAALATLGCTNPATLSYGGNLDRPGKVAVIVGGSGLGDAAARRCAEAVAECALGSRPAAFTLDTSLELAVLSELRQAAVRARPTVPSLASTARTDAIAALLGFAATVLGTSAIVAYEADQESPHRFVHLNRKSCVLAAGGDPPEWVPLQVALTEGLDIPAPPELNGSRFDGLGELVDHCFASKARPRRLVATIAGEHDAYGVPYGFDDVRRRPIGVLCLVWQAGDERRLGPYEFAASRMIALHLARGYDERHSADTVRLVTSQLSFISDLPTSSQAGGLINCDEILPPRRDVSLIAPSVSQIVRGLVNLSGAMSVTCRLITGADGPSLSRYLVRLHCEGDECALDSPGRIALGETTSSVNAWVAATGEPVYLRKLIPAAEPGYYTSPDLESYVGLDRVRIYREGVQCELCVPIVAERRLVGTVNLEADRSYAFDAMAETVAEYAQLIGIALLESRRRIGVETVTEVEGFLDYRHRLDAQLRDLVADVSKVQALPDNLRKRYVVALEKVRSLVFMRRVPDVGGVIPGARISDVLAAGMKSVRWATRSAPIRDLCVQQWSDAVEAVYAAPVDEDAARALTFAIAQALHNVRKHGGSGDALAKREYSAMFRFGEARLGGRRNLYVAVSSTCPPSTFEHLNPQRVFREPIDHPERVSLGAFLAGEALRRCGGSAYLRVTHSPDHDCIVDAEFSVPTA